MKAKELGMKLQILRAARDVSQTTVAHAVGKSRSTYKSYEHGDSTPDPETLVRLCRYFNTTPNDLLEYMWFLSPARAWAIAKETPIEEHDDKCRYKTTSGGLLCDCVILTEHPEYLAAK